jgi:hypothetical protein
MPLKKAARCCPAPTGFAIAASACATSGCLHSATLSHPNWNSVGEACRQRALNSCGGVLRRTTLAQLPLQEHALQAPLHACCSHAALSDAPSAQEASSCHSKPLPTPELPAAELALCGACASCLTQRHAVLVATDLCLRYPCSTKWHANNVMGSSSDNTTESLQRTCASFTLPVASSQCGDSFRKGYTATRIMSGAAATMTSARHPRVGSTAHAIPARKMEPIVQKPSIRDRNWPLWAGAMYSMKRVYATWAPAACNKLDVHLKSTCWPTCQQIKQQPAPSRDHMQPVH